MSVDSRKTPYYLIDVQKVKENYEKLRDAITSVGRNDIISYSLKANYNPAIIEQLNDLGAYFEVCSEYEYNLIKNYSINNAHVIVNGCFFNDYSIYEDSILILDTYSQLSEWAKQGCKKKIGIRVNLDCMTTDHRFKNKETRFGIQFESSEVKALLKYVKLDNIICLHCHLSGNCREPSIYRDIVLELQKICKNNTLNGIQYFDIGGGYKIGKGLWNYTDYLNSISQVCPESIKIIFEPGNSLVRNCAEYHTEIIAIKTVNNENFFIADGSSLHIPNTNNVEMSFHIDCFRDGEEHFWGNKIFGNTCKESDLLIKFNVEQSLCIGDHFVLENVGAYSINNASSLILGKPNIYLKNSTDILIGNHVFNYVCKYSDCYNRSKRNNYSIINKKAIQKGLYAFIDNTGIILYIGVAYDRILSKRIVQHFRNDSGGLRSKLKDKQIKKLESSYLYICKIDDIQQKLCFEEAYIIGLYRPKFNYIGS